MKYKISEFASILGVTPDTLRLYEKYGIIKPIISDENNYRYFDDLDARNILRSRWYRSFNIPLSESTLLTNQADLDSIIGKFENREKELKEEIKKTKMLLDNLHETIDTCKKMKFSLGKCFVQDFPSIYRIIQTDHYNLISVSDTSLHEIVKQWMDLLPYTFYSFRIDQNFLLEDNLNSNLNNSYNFGLTITEKDAILLNIDINEYVEYYPSQNCIMSIIKIPEGSHISTKNIGHMLSYAKANNYTICGDIFGRVILAEKSEDNLYNYLSVHIPIE
ncbi:MAG: MerR family transcriptional regulator [Eubacteriaceae bacterium]